MYKKLLTSSALVASLLLTGCGEQDTNTDCRIDIQLAIDKSDFDGAVALLDGKCSTALEDSDKNFALATAYMGKAGFSAIDVVNSVLDSTDAGGDAFSTLALSIDSGKNDSTLTYLDMAKNYYLKSVSPDLNTSVCDTSSTDTRILNACFYIGFSQTIQATTTLTYLTKDVNTLVDSINNATTTPLDMQASTDALAWAVGISPLPNNSSINSSAIQINSQNYTHVEVTLPSGEVFYRLADSAAPSATSSTIVTDGYCDTNGDKTPCDGIENTDGSIDTTLTAASSCYACPLTISSTTPAPTVVDSLIKTLNAGLDVIVSTTTDGDIQNTLDTYIQDITGDPTATVQNTDLNVSQILDYLNK